MLDIGGESERWNELKTALQLSDESLASLLMNSYIGDDLSRTNKATSKKCKESFKSKKKNKLIYGHSSSNFTLSDYGVYFPGQEENNEDLETNITSVTEEVFNINYGHSVESDTHSRYNQSHCPAPSYVTDPCAAARENAYIVYTSCLIRLANQTPPSQCNVKNCKADVSMIKKSSGTSVHFKWNCSKGHIIREWSSQPSLQGQGHLGDLMLASGIIMSGCNYNQVALMLKIMNVECLNSESFEYYNSNFVVPKISTSWNTEQEEILSTLEGREVILLGCSVNNNKEWNQYLTFVVLDYETSEVLYISVVEKSEINCGLDKVEQKAFSTALQALQASGARVVEVVTNIEPRINSYLRKKFPDIKRSYDMWEGAKLIGKEIVQASHHAECSDLLLWLPDIISHFLETSKSCAEVSGSLWALTDEEAFKDNFITGIIHHTMNNHKWLGGECRHTDNDDNKPWLDPDSPAHNQLKQLLLDKHLSSVIGNFSTNRTTCGLESIIKYIQIYTPDTVHYSFMEYEARVYLAVLDYIHHRNLPSDVDDTGTEILSRRYSEYSDQFEYHEKQETKQYNHLPGIVEKIVGAALNTN